MFDVTPDRVALSVPRTYADLHIHSKFSRACSRDCDLEHLAWWAGRKGIGVVGTGDFTHPVWRAELGAKLVPDAPGLFRLRPDLERAVHDTLPAACRTPVRFMLSSDLYNVVFYKQASQEGQRCRRFGEGKVREASPGLVGCAGREEPGRRD